MEQRKQTRNENGVLAAVPKFDQFQNEEKTVRILQSSQ